MFLLEGLNQVLITSLAVSDSLANVSARFRKQTDIREVVRTFRSGGGFRTTWPHL